MTELNWNKRRLKKTSPANPQQIEATRTRKGCIYSVLYLNCTRGTRQCNRKNSKRYKNRKEERKHYLQMARFWTPDRYLLRTTTLGRDWRALCARRCWGLCAFGSIYHEGNPTAVRVLQMRKLRRPLPGSPAAWRLATWSCCITLFPRREGWSWRDYGTLSWAPPRWRIHRVGRSRGPQSTVPCAAFSLCVSSHWRGTVKRPCAVPKLHWVSFILLNKQYQHVRDLRIREFHTGKVTLLACKLYPRHLSSKHFPTRIILPWSPSRTLLQDKSWKETRLNMKFSLHVNGKEI